MHYYSKEAKLALFGTFCINFTSETIRHVMNLFIKEAELNETHWVLIDIGILAGMGSFIAWVSDSFTKRYNVFLLSVFLLMFTLIISTFTTTTSQLPQDIRLYFFYIGQPLISSFRSSYGIFISVFLEQVQIEALPDNGGYMRKYVFLFIMCLRSSQLVLVIVIAVSDYRFVPIAISFVLMIIFLTIFVNSHFDFYKAPYHFNMLNACYESLKSKKISLFKNDDSKLTMEDRMTIKLLLVLFPIFLILVATFSSSTMFLTYLNLTKTGIDYGKVIMILFTSWVLILPLMETFVIPFLRKHTFLKTSIHQLGIGFIFLAIALIFSASFEHNIETIWLTQPTKNGFGQLRFFNTMNDSVSISVGYSSVKIKPYGNTFFLLIPVKNETSEKVTVSLPNSSFSQEVKVEEMTSFSYFVTSSKVVRAVKKDPLNHLASLDDHNSYFYIATTELLQFNLTFSILDQKMMRIVQPSDVELYTVRPQTYNVSIEHEATTRYDDSYEFNARSVYVYLCFSSEEDFRTYGFVHITKIPRTDLTSMVLEILATMFGTCLMEVSALYFTHTETPVFLRATTFTVVVVGGFIISTCMEQNLLGLNVSSIFLFTMSFLIWCLVIIATYYALRFKFSKNAVK